MIDKNFFDKIATDHSARPKDLIFQDAYQDMLFMSEEKSLYGRYDIEQVVLQCIRQGDVEEAEGLFYNEFAKSLKLVEFFSDDYYKHLEYMSVSAITLYTRAAIDGGVYEQAAYAMQTCFLRKLSKATKLQEYYNLNYEAILTFTNAVRDLRHVSVGNKRIDQVKAYIHHNIGKPLTVKTIANDFNMSSDHLSRVFQKEVGVAIKLYIWQERMHAACRLLKYTDYTLSDISAMLGFSSQSYFGKIFRLLVGETPAKYRIINKKNLHI